MGTTSRIGRKGRTIRITEKGESRGRGMRPEVAEEIGGTSLAFFEPAHTSAEGCARSFLLEAIIQLTAEIKNVSGSLRVCDVVSGATVCRG